MVASTRTQIRVDFGGAGKDGAWLTVNLDGDGKAHNTPDIVADITAAARQLGQHFAPNSIDEAQCIATLEHLPPWDVVETLRYWRGFMKYGAALTITVPDMPAIFAGYAEGRYGAEVLAGMLYGPKAWQQKTPFEAHRWGWDYSSLEGTLREAGFWHVERIEEPEPGFFVDDYRVAMLAVRALAI